MSEIKVSVEGSSLGAKVRRIKPPGSCDVCHKAIDTTRGWVDGAVKGTGGCWAIMCIPCFAKHGAGIGTGLGQKYRRTE